MAVSVVVLTVALIVLSIVFAGVDAIYPLLWVVCAVITAFAVQRKGYPWMLGLVGGLLLGPIGIIIAIPFLPDSRWGRPGRSPDVCPDCGTKITIRGGIISPHSQGGEFVECPKCGWTRRTEWWLSRLFRWFGM